MTKLSACLIFICAHFLSMGQITVMGHTMLNNSPIYNTKIFVKADGVVTRTLATGPRSDFKLDLLFGKVYEVYFQNQLSPVMHMEVIANNIPADKSHYLMTYELNVPFVNKKDEDVDTAVFQKTFHKVFFNGVNRMVDDTSYNSEFESKVIRKTGYTNKSLLEQNPNASLIFSGKIRSDKINGALSNREISLLGRNGQVLKTTRTNRTGGFAFTSVIPAEAEGIRLEVPDTLGLDRLCIINSLNETICESSVQGKTCSWSLNQQVKNLLLDNNYTSNIGGKLVFSSPREKKFFSGQTVYLTNRMHTVLKKTTTNLVGTFVFEGIKPDNIYYISVDKSEVMPGAKIDLLNKEDHYIATLDTMTAGRKSLKLPTNPNKTFDNISIADNEMKMDIKARIFGDDVNNPIGKLKIILLNDDYVVIDSAITDNFGAFKFKYLPFLKKFYLSAENTDNVLDVFKNILIYSTEDDNLVKIMTHQKGTKFTYRPVLAEISRLRDIEIEDPWLELVGPENKESTASADDFSSKFAAGKNTPRLIVENIHFEANDSKITDQAREVLDKVVVVLKKNQALRIEVGAHTDSKGSAAANLKLSDERAKVVRQYIVNAGISGDRIFSKGYGESKLINHCDDQHECPEKEHAVNRRIEFKILGEQEEQKK